MNFKFSKSKLFLCTGLIALSTAANASNQDKLEEIMGRKFTKEEYTALETVYGSDVNDMVNSLLKTSSFDNETKSERKNSDLTYQQKERFEEIVQLGRTKNIDIKEFLKKCETKEFNASNDMDYVLDEIKSDLEKQPDFLGASYILKNSKEIGDAYAVIRIASDLNLKLKENMEKFYLEAYDPISILNLIKKSLTLTNFKTIKDVYDLERTLLYQVDAKALVIMSKSLPDITDQALWFINVYEAVDIIASRSKSQYFQKIGGDIFKQTNRIGFWTSQNQTSEQIEHILKEGKERYFRDLKKGKIKSWEKTHKTEKSIYDIKNIKIN